MQSSDIHHTDDAVIEQTLGALRRIGFLRDLKFGRPSRPGANARLRVKGPFGSVTYLMEVKPKLSTSAVSSLSHRRRHQNQSDERRLLIIPYAPPVLAEQLQHERIEFVDAVGNAYLDGPIYLFVTGRKPQRTSVHPSRAARPAGLRLVYVLLRDPAALHKTQRELAAAAGIALGGVPAILRDIRERGYLRPSASGVQVLANLRDLFFDWEHGYSELLRPKLHRQACRLAGANRSIDDVLTPLRQRSDVLIGGELGAAILTKHLRPETATLHIDGDEKPIMTALRLLPDPHGTITLLRTFGTQNAAETAPANTRLADPMLIHAELAQTTGDRSKEIGDLVLDHYILPRFA